METDRLDDCPSPRRSYDLTKGPETSRSYTYDLEDNRLDKFLLPFPGYRCIMRNSRGWPSYGNEFSDGAAAMVLWWLGKESERHNSLIEELRKAGRVNGWRLI